MLSPADNPANVRIKLTNYLNAGIVVWIVDPEEKTFEVYVPDQSPKRLSSDDTISGGAVLPDFEVPVTKIFT